MLDAMRNRWPAAVGGALALAGLVGGGAGVARAQDDAAVTIRYPAGIYAGTCGEAIGEPIYDLGTVSFRTEGGDSPEVEDVQGLQVSPPVMEAEATVETGIDDLLDQNNPRSIVVFGEGEGAQPVACGVLGGSVLDDELVIGIRPLNDSNFYGVAILAGGDETEVTVYVFEDQGPTGPAGMEATPTT